MKVKIFWILTLTLVGVIKLQNNQPRHKPNMAQNCVTSSTESQKLVVGYAHIYSHGGYIMRWWWGSRCKGLIHITNHVSSLCPFKQSVPIIQMTHARRPAAVQFDKPLSPHASRIVRQYSTHRPWWTAGCPWRSFAGASNTPLCSAPVGRPPSSPPDTSAAVRLARAKSLFNRNKNKKSWSKYYFYSVLWTFYQIIMGWYCGTPCIYFNPLTPLTL